MKCHVTESEDFIQIHTEYAADLPPLFRSRGGKWEGGAWVWRKGGSAHGKAIAADLFGSDPEKVKVHIPVNHAGIVAREAALRIGGYVLATRTGRDRYANLHATLVAGSIPSSGGSVKNPRVAASDDAVFELHVCRDFAVRHGLEIVP